MVTHANIAERGTALIIGRGNIALRHGQVLRDLGFKVVFVSRRDGADSYRSIAEAATVANIAYAVVATDTAQHLQALETLSGHYAGPVLVEKPFAPRQWRDEELPVFTRVGIAYQLRFHPAVTALRDWLRGLANATATNVMAYCGQYLPDWRPGRDYRLSYSAKADQGGGAVLDLSHDIDLVAHLFGPLEITHAAGGAWSELETTSEDVAMITATAARARGVQIQLDYLNRSPRRFLMANVGAHSIYADLIGNTLAIDGQEQQLSSLNGDGMLRDMHADFLQSMQHVCSLPEAVSLQGTLDAIKARLAQSPERSG